MNSDKVNILIVDDKEDKLLSLEAVLSDLGENIVCATSGREALRHLLTTDFAVILLDVNMPGMDGFETAAVIRQRKSTEHTPILFITAYGDEMYISRGYSLGAVDYIQTPVVPEVLRTKVSVFVELYRKTHQLRQQAERLEQRAAQLAALASELTEAEQKERRRLAQILHDHLQQLLVAARMRVNTLRRRAPDDKLPQTLEQIDQVLNQSIEAARSLTIELSPPILYDGGLVAALHWQARRMLDGHHFTVDVHAPEDLDIPPEPLGAFLFQSVRELLFNCVKHSRTDRATVTVAADGQTLMVTVEDEGAGFFEADIAASGKTDHFGIFSIRERVQLLNGFMEIDSAPGQGTAVTICVPFAATRPAAAQEPEAAAQPARALKPAAKPAGPRIRVMLVDDHEILRKGVAGLLADQPDLDVVAEASDGAEAVQRAREVNPDVIVMDIAMPRMTGIEATRRIMRDMPATRIIGLSMHEEDDMATAMIDAGATAYLAKGGAPDRLVNAIRNAHAAAQSAPTLTVTPAITTS